MTEQEFIIEITKLPVKITDEKINLIYRYYNFLIEYNNKVNLTSIIDQQEALLKHYYDSLTPSLVIDLNKVDSLLDVGTGAGFPGVVLKIFFPHLKLTLLDSNHKKTEFLKQLINYLNLDNVEIILERSEIYAINHINKFDLVIARAVKSLDVLLELCLPMVKINGHFISMKGKLDQELAENEKVISFLGGKIKNCYKFNLPIDNSDRCLLLINKISPTSNDYPREYSQISKKPLKIIAK